MATDKLVVIDGAQLVGTLTRAAGEITFSD